jgi:FkbM family methyltransferase
LKLIPTKFSFIDIGANQGLYSIIAAKNPCCKKVLAFEPIQSVYKLLKKNIGINNVEDKCLIYRKAIDNVPAKRKIGFDSEHSGKTSIAIENKLTSSYVKIETINFKYLDILFSELNEDIYIKVDVEGHEIIVLQEIFKTKKSSLICSVFYEVDTKWVNPSNIKKLLQKEGFVIFKKIGSNKNHYDVLATK